MLQHIKNTPCRIALIGVKDSVIYEEKEILIEPSESEFDYLESGMALNELKGKGSFDKHWIELQDILHKYPLVVATNDGYDAEVLYNAIKDLGFSVILFLMLHQKYDAKKRSYSFLCFQRPL